MIRHTPLISIITPTLNDGAALTRNIESIDAQNWPRIEHVIIDGGQGATDSDSNSYNCRRIRISTPPKGVYNAINIGLEASSGDYIVVLNGNDRLPRPDILQRVADAFSSVDAPDFIYGPIFFSDSNGKVTRRYRTDGFSGKDLRHGFAPPHPSLYISRHTLQAVGLYDCSYITAADFDMFVRLFSTPGLRGRGLDFDLAEMSAGGMSGKWHNRLFTNPREKMRSLRSHGFNVSPFSLIIRYFRLFKEYFI